ncbi:MAG: response regulator transcription factor [Candidatus Dormibacteria bacterium]
MPALRVLLADDDPRLLHIVGMYLRMEGFDVVTAEDGGEAVQLLGDTGFDVAILDVMMPEVDGVEICQRIRANPATHEMPVLIFTALSRASDAERARLAGATHMITKPFSLPGLGAVVRACATEPSALAS